MEESGYYEFPALCSRWNTTASDIYGEAPAMDALGDCRMLQKIAQDSRIALEKEVNPPTAVLNNGGLGRPVDVSPGALNYFANLTQGQNVIVPLYQVRAHLQAAEAIKAQLKQQIKEAFYNDLFLMINQVSSQMTATEVAERNDEKMLLLGPVLDRLRSELFQPLIERVFGVMERSGLVPEPPDMLRGREIKVEFINILAQAQKQTGIAAINNTVAFIGNLAQINPEVLDKLNADEAVDEVAEMNGVPPSLIRPDEEVAQIRAQRQQQQQAQQQAAALQQGADIAETGARAARESGLVDAMSAVQGGGNA